MSQETRHQDQFAQVNRLDRIVSIFRKLVSNRTAAAALLTIVTVALIAIFAPYVAPYSPTRQFTTPAGQFPPLPPLSESANGHFFILGTDQLGRDIVSRLVYGTRPLLLVVFGSMTLSATIGLPAGLLSAYYGGYVDDGIMRLMDVIISFPAVVMAIMLMALIGVGGFDLFGFHVPHLATLIFAMGIIFSPRLGRVVRGAALAEKNRGYVDAARVSGASDRNIIFRQIGPNVIPPSVVQMTIDMSLTVIVVAGLGFIGVGIQPPEPSWGGMLADSRDFLVTNKWWLSVIPGIAILIVSLSFNMLGDGINDVFDPNYDSENEMNR